MSSHFGKLRQLLGTGKEKHVHHDEFTEAETDIELRKEGAQKLHSAFDAYQTALSKKKFSEAAGDTLLAIDALGMVMVSHGEQFSDESNFGRSLVNLGRAHQVIATLQMTYALQLKETFIAGLEAFMGEIREYDGLRKELETRRQNLESATTKFEKARNTKKEREAEDDLERAQQRHRETEEDIRAHMDSLQDNEIAQEQQLLSFLELETSFVQQYLDVLKDVRKDWPDAYASPSLRQSMTSKPSTMPAVSPPSNPTPGRYDSSEDERPPSRNSVKAKHRKSESTSSRPSSRLSRRRTNSSATSSKDKAEKEEAKARRLSVTGWASNAVDSLASRNKKSKDRETFSTLDDEHDVPPKGSNSDNTPTNARKNSFSLSRKMSKKKQSRENVGHGPSTTGVPRILNPPSLRDKKTVKAMYDFNGSADELTFRAGTEIKVLNEVVEGWWMGEIDGKKGLFPTSYVSSSPRASPHLPPRPYRAEEKSDVEPPRQTADRYTGAVPRDDDYLTSDLEELSQPPLSHNHTPIYGAFTDVAASDRADDTDNESLQPARPRRFSDDMDVFKDSSSPPKAKASTTFSTPKMRTRNLSRSEDIASQPLLRSQSEQGPPSPIDNHTYHATPKKVPPPPPPRRTPVSSNSASPAIPERKRGPTVTARPTTNGSNFVSRSSFDSNPSMPASASNSSLSVDHGNEQLDYDVSPFESAAELPPVTQGCGRFHSNPFYPKGMCGNCKAFHT